MEPTSSTKRASNLRKVGWLGVASMLAMALLAPGAGSALAATGGSVTICHGTGSNSNPYVTESPSVQANGATEGELTGGHSNHVGPLWFDGIAVAWGDIIPPYIYLPNNFHFPGLNWTAEGQAIYNNGCNALTTTSTSSSTATTSTTETTLTITTGTSTTETTVTTATTATTVTSSTSSSQSVGGETDAPTPVVTLPPTDAFSGPGGPSGDSWRILLIVGAALLASVLVLSPAKASRRR